MAEEGGQIFRRETVDSAEWQLITQINMAFMSASEQEADFWTDYQFKPKGKSWRRKYQNFIFSFRDLVNKSETNVGQQYKDKVGEIKKHLNDCYTLQTNPDMTDADFHNYSDILTQAGMLDIKRYIPSFREKAVRR